MQINVTFDAAKRHRAATHEAAHAVVIHACGLVVEHMQLVGESSGFTEPASVEGQELSRCDELCALGTAALAGNLGVEVMLGEEEAAAERQDAVSSTQSDVFKVEGYAQKVIDECDPGSDLPTVVDAFRQRARQVLSNTDAQQALGRVRDALLASTHRALCVSHVRRAIEGTVDDSPCGTERKYDDVLGP